jgi:hypothetical protein
MRHPTSPTTPERWLSTHEAADIMGCHPQTVRDRCARGELAFIVDLTSGHRRIAASVLAARGYAVPNTPSIPAPPRPPRTPAAGFRASVTTEVEGALADAAAEHIADRVLAVLTDRDEALTATAQRLGQMQAALQALAQRPRLLARLRADGLLAGSERRASSPEHTP